MFFNCCKRNCCCRQDNRHEKDYCDIKDRYDYDKCDKRDDKHDKCECDKKEKCCYHINFEKKYCCDKDNDNRFDHRDNCYQNERNFDNRNYYGEYNNLGYFADNNKEYNYEQDHHKSYSKENNSKSHDNDNDLDYKSYTPNWENDKECRCEKNKHDKCDKNNWNNNCCKPVKYICIPFDKY
ncbi:MAG: hypothetical protein ACLRFE_03025 [Clostridia bacterium]